jgi:hypothetical protein
MNEIDSNRRVVVLRAAFLIGALADGLIAIEWYLISLGLVDMPIHPSIFVGRGQDYKFVLGIAGLFMMGWSFLLYWVSLKPVERTKSAPGPRPFVVGFASTVGPLCNPLGGMDILYRSARF